MPGRVREGLLVGLLAVVVVGGTVAAVRRQVPPRHALDVTAWLLVAGAVGIVPLRRRWPVPALVGGAAIVALYLGRGYPYGPIVLVVCLLAYSLASRASGRRTVAGVVGAALLLVPAQLGAVDAGEVLLFLGVALAWLGVPVWLAATVRLYRAHRVDAAARALADERLRLSRDVHDVVAHSLSVISLQSAAALRVWEQSPADAHAAVRSIRAASVEALRDLRQTLGELRGEASARGIADVGDLVARLDGDALRVSLRVTGEPRALPAAADACAYRLVQEALTNVVRHAAAGAAAVTVAYEAAGVRLAIEDDGAGAGGEAGRGLLGMRERVAALGGTVSAAPRDGGGFAVRAWIPVVGA
ncbi:sensor histidine kinase [Dactylosporangium sp. NPDC051541]|uniref:sensor histidine kinase n=1 Tax=Dactylosporangium sp. NPDC051541 TaxID=3363977 RepID=UPI00378EF6B5